MLLLFLLVVVVVVVVVVVLIRLAVVGLSSHLAVINNRAPCCLSLSLSLSLALFLNSHLHYCLHFVSFVCSFSNATTTTTTTWIIRFVSFRFVQVINNTNTTCHHRLLRYHLLFNLYNQLVHTSSYLFIYLFIYPLEPTRFGRQNST